MILLLFFAFISGVVTILAPCIWPLLPIVLSTSITGGGGHKRSLGITLGVMLSFMLFTLSVSYLVSIFHLDPNVLRLFAVVVLSILGLTMIIPRLTVLFELAVNRVSSLFPGSSTTHSGFWGGLFTGLTLGIVWSPCAGPILASIATLAATGQVSLDVILVTLAYVTGVGIPLFAFSYGGQRVITRSRFLTRYTGRIQQAFGLIMLLTALSIYTNYDKVLQVKLLSVFPQFATTLNSFESNSAITEQLAKLKNQATPLSLSDALFNSQRTAPEFTGITAWLNAEKPLTSTDLRGKVVLVDFWTYTCINCLRTLPHVKSWYEKYKDKGFVVVGVHTPEFAFEKERQNVEKAIQQYGITYPVALDNDYKTWNAFENQYWPAEYLIDAKGVIRRIHFGEGNYEEMEQAIQKLLEENGQNVSHTISPMPDETPQIELSPETYLGSERMEYLMDQGNAQNGLHHFTLQSPIPNTFSLGGTWTIADEYAISGDNAVLEYNFTAKKVFLVMKPEGNGKKVKVFLDKNIVTTDGGEDTTSGIVTLDGDRLYELLNLSRSGSHTLRLEFLSPGIKVYAFTFGG